jgi:GNAT superfamily N-acetyltransferase
VTPVNHPKDRTLFRPLTPEIWLDLVLLFTERGPQNGCWCMFWRQTRAEYRQQFGELNKQAFKQIVEAGRTPGILAYRDGKPAGWCAIAPREEFTSLERSRTLKRLDDQPVWSIVCFFVTKAERRKNLTSQLIRAAIEYARAHGAIIVEAYPIRAEIGGNLTYEGYMGLESTFARLGFQVVAQRSDRRPVMRFIIGAEQ